MSGDRSMRIAELNDRFRTDLGSEHVAADIPGQVILTRGIASHPQCVIDTILQRVSEFDHFNRDNDPYAEHDFGAFENLDAGKVFWKIDYYENAVCKWGAECPEDPLRSYRVLTIMLAEEY